MPVAHACLCAMPQWLARAGGVSARPRACAHARDLRSGCWAGCCASTGVHPLNMGVLPPACVVGVRRGAQHTVCTHACTHASWPSQPPPKRGTTRRQWLTRTARRWWSCVVVSASKHGLLVQPRVDGHLLLPHLRHSRSSLLPQQQVARSFALGKCSLTCWDI